MEHRRCSENAPANNLQAFQAASPAHPDCTLFFHPLLGLASFPLAAAT
jgi:hypothetical protein